MNLQEFNNLKIGDKVVVHDNICADNLYAGHYEKALTYCSKEGDVEVKYSYLSRSGKQEIRVGIRFQDKSYFIFNIRDIYIMQDKQTKTPHKHAAIIKAWADGEEIEFLTSKGVWCFVGSCPAWCYDEYRIKPKFEKRYKYAFPGSSDWYISSFYYKDDSTFRAESGYTGSIFEKIEASGKDFQCN